MKILITLIILVILSSCSTAKYQSYSIHTNGKSTLVDEKVRVTIGKKKVKIKFNDKKMVYDIVEKNNLYKRYTIFKLKRHSIGKEALFENGGSVRMYYDDKTWLEIPISKECNKTDTLYVFK